jgi:hypothetical protein
MNIQTFKVKQYNSTYKHILMVDGKPILITQSANRLSQCIAYLSDKRIEIKDGTIKKILDSISKGE